MKETITDDNFVLYAARYYIPACFDQEEFFNELKRLKYIKRLFNRYRDAKEIKERLILNHLITLYNIFSPESCTRMLFYKLHGYYDLLKPFLLLLSFCPDIVENIHGENVNTNDILMDDNIISILRKI
jgi:hypothetical protein